MNNDLNLALKIKATQEGLGEIKSIITELDKAGVETTEWKQAIDGLDKSLADAGKNQELIDNFVDLRRETTDTARALEEAQQKAQKLAKELKDTENPTKAQSVAFEKARTEVRKASEAYQNNRQSVQKLRKELKSAGIETRNLASHQVAVNKSTASVDDKVNALTRDLKKQVTQINSVTSANQRQAASHRKIRDGVESISTQLGALQRNAVALFGVTQGAQLVGDLGRMADEYTNLAARVRLAVGEGDAFEAGMADIRETANETGSALESVGELYVTLNRATKELEISQQEVAALTDTISKSFLVSGSSAQAADAAITQLAQGLQSGVLRGDEFNSVMEQSPRLAQALADSLQVTRGELRAMAEDGKLTTEVIVNALQDQSAAIAQEAEKIPDTIGRALQRVNNEFMLAVGEIDQAAGVSATVAEALSSVAANMDQVIDLLELAGEVATAALLRKYVPAVIASSKAMVTAARDGTLFAGSLTAVEGSAKGAAGGMALLKNGLQLLAVTYAVDQVFELVGAIGELRQASRELGDSQEAVAAQNNALANAYALISERTGVVVRNMQDLDAALAAGTIVIDEQTNSYLSAADAAERKASADKALAESSVQMSYTQEQLSARLAETNKQLQQAVEDNSKLESVMSGALLDALKNGEAGVGAFAIALRGVEQTGQLTTEQIENGLSVALQKLSNEERARFGDLLREAMQKIKDGAQSAGLSVEQLQAQIDALNASEIDAALKRLGTSQAELNNQITQGTRQSIADLEILKEQLNNTGRSGTEAASVLEPALAGVFKNARTEADKAALNAVLDSYRQSGMITAEAFNELSAELAGTTQQMANLGTAGVDAGQRIKASAHEAAAATSELAIAAEEAGNDVQGLAAGLAEWFIGVRNELYELSEQTGQLFDRRMGIDSTGPVTEIESIKQSIISLGEQIRDVERANMLLFDATGLREWETEVVRSSNSAKAEYLQQKLKVLEYYEAIQSGVGNQQALITNAERSIDKMNLLGDEDLSQLRSALDAANRKLEQMNENASNTLGNLRDELDRLNGDTESIQQRDYEQKKAELQAELDAARKAGQDQAVADLTESLRILEEVRKAQKAAAKESGSSSQSSNSSSSSSTASSSSGSSSSSGGQQGYFTVKVELPDGSNQTIKTTNQAEALKLKDVLDELAKYKSLSGA